VYKLGSVNQCTLGVSLLMSLVHVLLGLSPSILCLGEEELGALGAAKRDGSA
jgi:hypothetical protein